MDFSNSNAYDTANFDKQLNRGGRRRWTFQFTKYQESLWVSVDQICMYALPVLHQDRNGEISDQSTATAPLGWGRGDCFMWSLPGYDMDGATSGTKESLYVLCRRQRGPVEAGSKLSGDYQDGM